MFNNCSIMVIRADAPSEILQLEVDKKTQQSICNAFADAVSELAEGKTRVPFDGSYKPNDDEFLSIERFELPNEIKEALRNPIGVPAYQAERGSFPDIKAVFVGKCIRTNDSETFLVAFQRFRKEQYISKKGLNLYYSNNTFHHEHHFGITISERIDCFYTEGELRFSSFFFARQVFDLNPYYRCATDAEVCAFVSNALLYVEHQQEITEMANSWARRRIAMINDSGVLERYSAFQIKELAKEAGIDIAVTGGRIVIPNDKGQFKIILSFLVEEAYMGPFSKNTYLTNSKRQAKNRAASGSGALPVLPGQS